MIIAIDATSIGWQLGRDETVTRSLLRGLAAVVRPRNRVLVLATAGAELPREAGPRRGFLVDRVVRRSRSVHFGYTLPQWLATLVRRGERPDIVVSLTHTPLWSPAPVALMATDPSFAHLPDTYPRATRLPLRTLVRHQVGAAAAVMTTSEFCRSDLVASFGLPRSAVHVVPLAIDPPGGVVAATRKALADRGVRPPYLLHLGHVHPRKNVHLAIQAFRSAQAENPRLAGHRFVVAGRRRFGSQAEDLAASGAARGTIVFLDRVSDAEREVLLSDAEALVYLSTSEGFGLPPLEAMARGTAVVASTAAAVPEVCGSAALLVDPHRPDEVRHCVRQVLLDSWLRSDLVRCGYDRVKDFTPEQTGRALLAALASVRGRSVSAEVAPRRAS
ncbi:MAG TPA: glycosyltransferase family 1 protein [Propionibacteriaceae bacterium]|nr:glycosyltransferase family 1 protein [Propionibacteriaceae bacterium]